MLGAAIQALYIGLVTPGGAMPADVNFAAWIGIPLAMVSGATAEYALSLSIPLSFLGGNIYATVTINCLFVHKQTGLSKGANWNRQKKSCSWSGHQLRPTLLPHFVGELLGAQFVPKMVEAIPESVGAILQLFGSYASFGRFLLSCSTMLLKRIPI